MTYRTATAKLRLVYLLAAIATAAIIGLCILGDDRADCTASLDVCEYSLR